MSGRCARQYPFRPALCGEPIIANHNNRPEAGLQDTRADAPSESDGIRQGLVLKAVSGQYLVHADADDSGGAHPVVCTLRGNLKKTFTYSTSDSFSRRVTKAKRPFTKDVVAIGDRVRFTPSDAADDTGVIEEILPRRTRFARAAFRGQEQTLVTNLDQLVIVFACAEPNPDLWRIDRWLVASEANGLEPLLVANKRDLVDDATFAARFADYTRIGYRVLGTSVRAPEGIEELRAALKNRISAFTGPSGVGKSSLLNQMQPGLKLATGDIGGTTFKGKHTTTVRELLPLESGGWVADTPGLRQLELLDLDRESLAQCFVEFRPFLATPCRFRNCRHQNEPGCNLKAAVERGDVAARRYESFLILAGEIKE